MAAPNRNPHSHPVPQPVKAAKRWARKLRELIDRARHNIKRLTSVRNRRKRALAEVVDRIQHFERRQREYEREHGHPSQKLREELIHLRERAHNLRSVREKLTEAIRKLVALVNERTYKLRQAVARIARIRRRRENRQPATGTGPWGGSMSIVEQEVVPIMLKYGPITSRKRWETYGNPSSDHYMGNTTAYAADCGIAERHDVLDEIGRALGIGSMSDYASYYITRSGNRFRVQGIAGTHGTGPHLHVGVRRA